jgi:hypothetical protein
MQPRLPIDVNITNKTMESGIPGFQTTFLPRFDVLRKIMTDNINDNKRRMQYYFDKKSKALDVKENDLVYKFRDGSPSGIHANVSPKLLPRYDGPYKILKILANAAQLQRVSDGKILTAWINLNKLKPVRHCRTSLEEKYGRHRSVTPADTSSDIDHQRGAVDASDSAATDRPPPNIGDSNTPAQDHKIHPSRQVALARQRPAVSSTRSEARDQ